MAAAAARVALRLRGSEPAGGRLGPASLSRGGMSSGGWIRGSRAPDAPSKDGASCASACVRLAVPGCAHTVWGCISRPGKAGFEWSRGRKVKPGPGGSILCWISGSYYIMQNTSFQFFFCN